MSFEIASISFIQADVAKKEPIEMGALLIANRMWLILEGFLNGYAFTEAGVDRLHTLVHTDLSVRIN